MTSTLENQNYQYFGYRSKYISKYIFSLFTLDGNIKNCTCIIVGDKYNNNKIQVVTRIL